MMRGMAEEAGKYNLRGALIGFASKGPVSTPTLVHNLQELHEVFGHPQPHDDHYLIYAAEQFLLSGQDLFLVRVADPRTSRTACLPVHDEAGRVSFVVEADSPGAAGNETKVLVINDKLAEEFTLNVFHNGVQVESWGGLTKSPESRYYVGGFINLVSNYIRIIDRPECSSPPADGTYKLGDIRAEGAERGSNGKTDEGDKAELLEEGVVLLADKEYEFDVVAVPGCTAPRVVGTLLNMCEERGDCIAIVDPPHDLSYLETALWQREMRFVTDYGSLFWPWLLVRDSHNRRDVWVPPSGSVMAAIARSDTISAPWFAPTGTSRGIVPGVLDVAQRPEKGEGKVLNSNVVNPIVHLANTGGFVLNSQKTLGGGRINVRRMLLYVNDMITKSVERMPDDSGDQSYGEQFARLCDEVLADIKAAGGINDYSIQAQTELGDKKVGVRVSIQAKGAKEFVVLDYILQRPGENVGAC